MAEGFWYVVKLLSKARPNRLRLSNSRKEFHQATYQKPSDIVRCELDIETFFV